jgi:type IV pilus assembly protein PilW
MAPRVRQGGLSLIELMVAMTLGLLLLTGFLALHYSTRTSFAGLEENTQLQQNARFALTELARDIRMAGSFGCAGTAPVNNQSSSTSPFYRYDTTTNGVTVYTGIASLGAVFSAADSVASGSPILKVQYGRGGSIVTGGNASPTITQLTVQLPNAQTFDAAAPVLVLASCGRVDVVAQPLASTGSGTYTLSNLPALPNNLLTSSASGTHDSSLEVLQLVTRYYYVKNSSGSRGLFAKSLADDGTVADIPVAEDVNAMTVELGAINQPANVSPTVQYAANCGGALGCNQIGLVRVGLTLQSSSVQATGSTGFLTQRYNTTIALRNHGVQPQ